MMQDVSQRFLDAIGQPQKRVSRVTFTPAGGEPEELVIVGGQVALDSAAFYRRRARLSVIGGAEMYRRLAVPGGIFTIEHGIDFGGTVELVTVFTGTADAPQQRHGGGQIDLALMDRSLQVERARFLTPYSPDRLAPRTNAIVGLIQEAVPGVSIENQSTDGGSVGADAMWRESRADAIRSLLRDSESEGFFTPQGGYLLRDLPSIDDPVAWTARGIILSQPVKSSGTEVPYNMVVVRPATADGSQSWPQQVATVSPDSPNHPDKVGQIPYFYSSPTIDSASRAYSVALSTLERIQGAAAVLSADIISNPALEGGDVIQVIVPGENGAAAETFTHFVNTFTLDLNSGNMTIGTRSRGAEDV